MRKPRPYIPRMDPVDRSNCPIAYTLDQIGDRWSLLIVRDLLLDGPRKFSDLERTVVGASPSVLSARLKALAERGLIERRIYQEHPIRAEYLLTEKGRALAPVVKAMRAFGEAQRARG